MTGELWTDNATGKGGKGAINLVMHLEGWEQGRYKDAVRVLAEHFSPESVTADMGRKAALEGATAVSKLKQEPLPMPEPVLSNWPRARRYLEDVLRAAGFTDLRIDETVLRRDRDADIRGFVVVATGLVRQSDRQGDGEGLGGRAQSPPRPARPVAGPLPGHGAHPWQVPRSR